MAGYLHPLRFRLVSLVARAFRRPLHSTFVAAVRVPPWPATIPKQSIQPCFNLHVVLLGNPPRQGAHSQRGAAKPHPILVWTGLVTQAGLFFTDPAVRFSNGERILAAMTTPCYFEISNNSIRKGRLAFLFRHKGVRVRDRIQVTSPSLPRFALRRGYFLQVRVPQFPY